MRIKTESYVFDRRIFKVETYSKTIRIMMKRSCKFKGNKKATKTIDTGVKIVQGICK